MNINGKIYRPPPIGFIELERLDTPGDNFRAQVHPPHVESVAFGQGFLSTYRPQVAAEVRDGQGWVIENDINARNRTLLVTVEYQEHAANFLTYVVAEDAMQRAFGYLREFLPEKGPDVWAMAQVQRRKIGEMQLARLQERLKPTGFYRFLQSLLGRRGDLFDGQG